MSRWVRHVHWLGVLVAGTALAAGHVAGVHDIAVIENGEGATRVLFRAGGLEELGDIAISRATLTVPVAGLAEDRVLELWIHPVTSAWDPSSVEWERGWSRPGGDFDDELLSIARLDLRSAATDVTFDVTSLMKEIVESEMQADGFILTVAPHDGIGIRTEDLPRFADLASAEVEVSYRSVPSAPRRQGSR